MKNWDDARVFLAVAESGSFSEAARELGVGQPTVSRRVAELEDALGWALFHRGRRGATLTTEGERLLPAAQQMARWAGELARASAGGDDSLDGRVRLTAPPGMAYDFLVPFGSWLRERHPGLYVDVLSSIAYLDLARGEADLAIRTRAPTDPALMSVFSIEVEVGAFVSEGYAASLPDCPEPADVDWICWAGPNERLTPRPELEALIPGFEPSFASDDYLVQCRACELGLGAMFLPRIQHPMLKDRGLVELDLELPPIPGGFHLVCARSARHIGRVRAVIEGLREQLGDVEGATLVEGSP